MNQGEPVSVEPAGPITRSEPAAVRPSVVLPQPVDAIRPDEDGRKRLHTRIIDGNRGYNPARAKTTLGEENIQVVERLIDQLINDQTVVSFLNEKILGNPRYQNKNVPLVILRRIVAAEHLNDIVKNLQYYKRENPADPFVRFYDANRSGSIVSIKDDLQLSMILDYVRANEIHVYNTSPRRKELSLPSRRQIEPGVTSSMDLVLGPTGVPDGQSGQVIYRDSVLAGNVEKPEYAFDRLIYQVIKKQLVPPETQLRWEKMRQGQLTAEGDRDTQLRKMIDEQYQWDERLRDVLKVGPDQGKNQVSQENRQLFDDCQRLLGEFMTRGFLAVATDESRMVIADPLLNDIDTQRLQRIKARFNNLTNTHHINSAPGQFRERAYKISNQIIDRRLFSEQAELLDEAPTIMEKVWVQMSGEPPTLPPRQERLVTPTTGPVVVEPGRRDSVTTPGTAPGVVDLPNGQEKVIPAPVEKKKPPGTTDETDVLPAPRNPQTPPDEPPPPSPPAVEPIYEHEVVGAGITDETVQNYLKMSEHVRATDTTHKSPRGFDRIDRLWRSVWQNNIFRSGFDQQALRFVRDIERTAKKGAGLDEAVPLMLTADDVNQILAGGREQWKKKNILQKAWYWARDRVVGTTGFFQTSEQALANEWLKDNVGTFTAKKGEAVQRTLAEQNAIGERYANIGEKNAAPTDMELRRFNDLGVIAKEMGETRHRLPDNLDQVADTKIHELIREYVDNRTRLSEEEADVILVNKMSSYILRDLRPRLSADLKKELNGVEAASNILSLAKKVQAKWSEYETADEAGQSKFVKVKFHLLIGRAEYGGARGKVEGGLFGLNERLARQLAQRELFRGQGLLANGVGYVGNAISDLGLYAGAYLAGAGVAAAKFGVKTPVAGLFTVFTGGLGGTTGAAFMNMLKEGGLVYETPFGGREGVLHGFGGRYTSEFSQLSRENASSREDPANTRRRTELRQALVPPKEFATIVSAVDGLLQKESLTADEQKELMWQLAELKARLRLTDLTSRRDGLKMGIPQNYIKFSEGQESQQMTELRSRLVEGRVKLARDQSAAALVAGFDTNVALMEGQLRIGNQRERLVNWLHREGHFADAQEALRFFDNNFKDIGITTGESLEAKMKKLKWLNRGHAFISATQVMLFSPFIGAGMNAVIGEGVSALSHLQQGGLGGIGKYFQDWGDTIGGNPPVTTVGGHLTSALSPLQKATLTVHNILAPPPDLTGVHDTLINGVKVQMPGSLRYQADGSGHSYLVDIRDGKVTDMSNYHLSTTSTGALAVGASKDLTGDGVINSEDNVIAESGFAKVMSDNGITISRGPDEITNTVAHLIKTGSVHEQVVDFHGTQIKMELPDGKLPNGDLWRAEWREYSPGKWDLVAFDQSTHDVVKLTDGRPVVFFKDVSFDFQHGKYNYDTDPNHSFAAKMNLNFTEQHVGGGKVVVIDNQGKGSGEWFRHETAIDNRHWHPEDRLKLYNWKVEGSGSDKAVVLDITSVGTVQSHGDQAKVGVYISLPGFSKQGIFVPAEHTNGHLQVRLDPNSTVKLANGWTVGDLSKAILNQDALKTFEHASELTDRRDIFNLGLDGKYGTIEAVSLEKTAHGMVAHVGATILGKSDITKVIDGPGGNIKIPQISLKDGIDDIVKTTTPTFKMDGPPINMDLHFIPLPMRSNIERSVKAGTGEQSRQPAPGSGNGTPPAITTLGQGSTNLSSPLFDQGEMGQVLNGAGISLENAAQNGFTNEAQKVQEAAARYERAKREKRSDEDLTAASAELMEALEILNKAEAKKENDEKKRSGQSQARSDKELEEGVAKKTLGQFTQINAVIETAIETKIKETTRPLTLPSVDGEPDLNAIRQQYRDRRDETLTRWGRQLDQDLAGAASSSLRRGLSTDEFRNRWDGKTPADFGNDTAKKDFLAKRYSAHYLAEMKKMITAVEEKNIAGQVRAALADEDSRIVGNIDLVRQARPVATAQADAEIAGLTNPTLDQRAAIVLRAIETGGPPIARLTRRLSRKTNRESVKKYLELKDRMKVKVQEELAKPEVQNRINQRSLRIEEQIGVWESEVGNPPRFPGLMQALKAKEAGLGEAAFAQKLERLKTQFNTLLALSNVDMQERIKSWYASLYSRLSPGSPVEVTVQADGTFRVKVGNLVDNIHSKAEAAKMLIADQIENEIYEQIYLTSASPGSVRQQTDSDRTAALNSYELLKTRYHVQPLTDGYWHYYFGQAGDQTLQTPFLPKPHGRIYLNTLSTFAPPVMLKIIEKLEESNRGKISTDKIKVQMKMVSPDKLLPLMQGNNPYDDQFRPDKIVLYFDQKDTEYIVHLIKEIYGDTQLNPGFSPSGRTPFLAGVLKGDDGRPMRGVAFAEEPPHDKKSYGEIVATALTNLVAQAAVDRATITNDYIDSNLDKKLEEIGLDPAHPFLFRQDRNSQFQSQVRVFLESNVINYGGSG